MKVILARAWFEGGWTGRCAQSRSRGDRRGGRRYVGYVVRNLSMSEEGEKRKWRVGRIDRCFTQVLQVKEEEKVEELI
jgi:hypothetical protein